MAPPVAFHHPASLEHDTGGHPERPQRLVAIGRVLDERDWLGFEARASPPVARDVLEAVHPRAHVAALEELCAAGGGRIDADTVASPGSWRAALHAAGGAVAMVDELLSGTGAEVGASLHRPPGHHAGAARAMGFCLFNNVAVAARHAHRAHGLRRVLVLDWDVHHGNGTNDIFHADPGVLFCSIHQAPLFPGTGAAEDVGSGRGVGHTVNLAVPAGSGDDVFCAWLAHVVAPLAHHYRPELVLVSAGFDAHVEDPLAGCRVTEAGFAAMSAQARQLAGEVGAPLGVVLEGGYALAPLARSVAGMLEAMGGEPAESAPAPAHPLTDAARARLAAHWPDLSG